MSELINISEQSPRLKVFDMSECRAFVARLEALWNAKDVSAILPMFTEDAEIEYGDLPSIKGRDELRRFLQDRFDHTAFYHLVKTVRLADEPLICVELDVRSSTVGSPALISRTRALEVLTISDSRIAKWELVANPHPRKEV
ncbi:nuclear transport factor 2 family protein [Bradyrhizobium septentrionale]|uniref:Nuclear transport factor 2 family protein n=1 Tax=Bradyrhizobium septentrionale TaxID=1404411 RepID=A0ABZ2P4I9_9BRAD